MSWDDLLRAVLVVGPGFVLLKVLYLFGGQHKRLEWEWAVWSVIASLPLAAVAGLLVTWGEGIKGPFPRDGVEVSSRFVLAVVVGLFLAWLWSRIRRSDNTQLRVFRRNLEDSAWDFILYEAAWKDSGVEVVVESEDKEVHYYGSIDTYGSEVAGAEPWLFLTFVSQWNEISKQWEVAEDPTVGYMFHKDEIKRLRIVGRSPEYAAAPANIAVGAGAAFDAQAVSGMDEEPAE